MNQKPIRTLKNAQDQRVRRTYSELLRASEELLCESAPDEMTVKQICERANIQRTTFYQHFRDIHDFWDWYILQKQNEFRSFASEANATDNAHDAFLEVANSTMKYLHQNEKLIRCLMNKQINGKLLFDLYVNTCVNEMKAKLGNLPETDEASGRTSVSFLAEFYVGGLISAFRWWIVNNKPIPEEDFMRYLRLRVERKDQQ